MKTAVLYHSQTGKTKKMAQYIVDGMASIEDIESESFIDRVRRCEFGQNGALSGKQILLVASPGGSGNGMLTCLEQMDRFCRHTGAVIFDYIGVNRWNSDYKRLTAYSAARATAEGRKAGETI